MVELIAKHSYAIRQTTHKNMEADDYKVNFSLQIIINYYSNNLRVTPKDRTVTAYTEEFYWFSSMNYL